MLHLNVIIWCLLRVCDCNLIELSGITLEQVQNTPYLGLQLDDKMWWEAQVQKLCRNVSSKLAVQNRLLKILNKTLLCIEPCIDYTVCLGSCPEQTKDLICRLQRRDARIITGNFELIMAADTHGYNTRASSQGVFKVPNPPQNF